MYVKQRDKYSCGPIAILNAIKWSGIKATYSSHFKRVSKLSNSGICGIDNHDITKALNNYKKLKYRIKKHITVEELEKHLIKGGSAIVGYDFRIDGEDVGHYSFIAGKKDRRFVIINHFVDKKIGHLTKKEINYILKYRGYEDSPYAWLISKR